MQRNMQSSTKIGLPFVQWNSHSVKSMIYVVNKKEGRRNIADKDTGLA